MYLLAVTIIAVMALFAVMLALYNIAGPVRSIKNRSAAMGSFAQSLGVTTEGSEHKLLNTISLRLPSFLKATWQRYLTERGSAAKGIGLEAYFTPETILKDINTNLMEQTPRYITYCGLIAAFAGVFTEYSLPEVQGVLLPAGAAGILCFCIAFIVKFIADNRSAKFNKALMGMIETIYTKVPGSSSASVVSLLVQWKEAQEKAAVKTGEMLTDKLNEVINNIILPFSTDIFEKAIKENIAPLLYNMSQLLDKGIMEFAQRNNEQLQQMLNMFVDSVSEVSKEKFEKMLEGANMSVRTIDEAIKFSTEITQKQHELFAEIETLRLDFSATGIEVIETQKALNERMTSLEGAYESAVNMTGDMSKTSEALKNSAIVIAQSIERSSAQFYDSAEDYKIETKQTNTLLEKAISNFAENRSAMEIMLTEYTQKNEENKQEYMQAMIKNTEDIRTYFEKHFEVMTSAQKEQLSEHAGMIKANIEGFVDSSSQKLLGVFGSITENTAKAYEKTLTEQALAMEMLAKSETDIKNISNGLLERIEEYEQKRGEIDIEREKKLAQMQFVFAQNIMRSVEEASNLSLERAATLLAESATKNLDYLSGTMRDQANLIEKFEATLEKAVVGIGETVEIGGQKLEGSVGKYSQELIDALEKTVQGNISVIESMKEHGLEVQKQANEMMDRTITASGETLEKTIGRLEDTVRKVMEEVTSSVRAAAEITSASADRFTEMSGGMQKEYEVYFSRMEGQTEKLMDDLSFKLEMITSNFGETVKETIGQFAGAASESIDVYSRNSREIMEGISEQSNSIGLYAQEIGSGISYLTGELKTVVEQFSTQVKDTLSSTFESFDEEVSKVVHRLAISAENIGEAVDNLPKAITKT